MPDNTTIERTIYKLEIDGSAYIQGADNLADSTKKLSTAQERANETVKKLKEANILLANETRTLTAEYNKGAKQLNEWIALQKKSSVENKDLATGIQLLTDNQKKLSSAIVVNKDLLKQSSVAIKDAEKATGGFSAGLKNVYGGLSRVANLIPGLGIAGLVALISGPVINAFKEWFETLNKTSEALKLIRANQENLNEVQANANKEAGKQITDLKILYEAATNVNLSMKDRLAAVKALQAEFPEYFKNISAENILNGDAKKAYDDLTASILATARATAARSKIEELETQRLDLAFQKQKVINATDAEQARTKDRQLATAGGAVVKVTAEQDKIIIRMRKDAALADIKSKDESLARQQKFLIDFAGLANVVQSVTEDPNKKAEREKAERNKTTKALKEIQNEFDRKKAELDAKLAALTRKEEDNESKIRIEFAARLAKEQLEIEKLLKEKKVTKKQAGILSAENIEINDIELNKALETFRKKVTTARKKLNDEILRLQNKNTLDQLNLIQNEFDRRAQLIDFNEKKEIENAKDANQTRLQDFENNSLLIFGQDFKNNQEYLDKKAILIAAGEQVITNIILKAAQERKDLTADILKLALKKTEEAQKEAAGDKKKKGKDPRVETVQDYAVAIGQLTESIISFWLKANEAESNALDRSISLQEKRVEAAQRIATRGNAQYLKAEEDRLKEMTVKRENAARRELAINAALQASQLLVGITGAIAKIATPGIGIAETIGAIAVIFGALATGYGLVKSLQGNQPKLKEGTPYLNRNGQPAGTDTIPAWLNEGEAVIPTDKNKAYHPTVRAVYEGTVPAEHLNQFVNTYHKIKAVPQPNYQRIKEAAELKITHDGRMAVSLNEQNKLIQENTDVQRQVLKTLHKMGVNVSLDQRGFAVTQMEVIRQMEIDKRV